MTIDRRATCTRCFLYGDVRSVESTLELFDAWRDPSAPSRRVASVVLTGNPLNVLATAEGIRDVERLRVGRFRFSLATVQTTVDRMLLPPCGATERPSRGAMVLMVDACEAMERTAAGRRAIDAAVRHASTSTHTMLVVIRNGARLARPLRDAVSAGAAIEVVRFDGHSPFLLPVVEGIVADSAPERLAIGGHGARVHSAAVGAGDYFLERAGDPSLLTRAARLRVVERAEIATALCENASDGRLDVATRLRELAVDITAGTFRDDPDGIVVHPVAA